ncbi:MAG: N-acetylmuramoyl-L-alanine amidase [Ruminococcus sp.]|nr:N-acetylmuramoyl-L-alanine amidase [Ruminococcus sp.]
MKFQDISCNYGIGTDGRVLLCVEEKNRSWCSSSNANDQRAITIECASETYAPYVMNSKVYNKLIKLCIDICKRNKEKKLLWFKDKNKSLSYKPKPDEMVLTVHRWFANKSCPGDWLYSRLGNVAKEVTKALNTSKKKESKSKETTTEKKSIDTIAREVINGKWGNGADRKKRLTKAGYDYNAVQKRVNELLR